MARWRRSRVQFKVTRHSSELCLRWATIWPSCLLSYLQQRINISCLTHLSWLIWESTDVICLPIWNYWHNSRLQNMIVDMTWFSRTYTGTSHLLEYSAHQLSLIINSMPLSCSPLISPLIHLSMYAWTSCMRRLKPLLKGFSELNNCLPQPSKPITRRQQKYLEPHWQLLTQGLCTLHPHRLSLACLK